MYIKVGIIYGWVLDVMNGFFPFWVNLATIHGEILDK